MSASAHLSFLTSTAGFKNNNYTKWFIASFSQRSEQTLYKGRPSLMVAADMFQLLCYDAVYCWHTGVCSLGFPSFWMQEFSASHPSLAPPLSPVSLNADSWAMACPGRSNNWKAWLLAAGGAAICESEWFGECCVRGRGGRGLCESQTASRGELLTPYRCQKAPRWPFAEPRLQIRKRVIIPLWGKYKHVLLWILSTLSRRQNTAEIWWKHLYSKFVSKGLLVPVQTQQPNRCCYILPGNCLRI